MKKQLLKVSFTLLLAMAGKICAQPVITGVNLGPFGSKSLGYVIPGAITPGTTGANQNWDYSAIPYNPTSYNIKYVDYAGISQPIKDTFPTGNVADEYYIGTTLALTLVFRLDANALTYLGYNATKFAAPDTQISFPHSYLQKKAGFLYDAYGTLKTPFGTYANTVRLREVNGTKFKYDYWQFSPLYILLMEYQVDTVTQVVSGQTFFENVAPSAINNLNENNKLDVFPNPANNQLSLVTSFTGNTKVEITDVQGRKLITQTISVQANVPSKMDISSLDNGVYLVKIYEGEKSYTKKIIVQ